MCFLWGHLNPCFGLLVMSPLGFKARVDLLSCVLRCLCITDSPDSLLVQHLLTSWPPAWQRSCFIHILTYKHWWDLSPGWSVPLSRSMWQDRHSTEWGILFEVFKENYSWTKKRNFFDTKSYYSSIMLCITWVISAKDQWLFAKQQNRNRCLFAEELFSNYDCIFITGFGEKAG